MATKSDIEVICGVELCAGLKSRIEDTVHVITDLLDVNCNSVDRWGVFMDVFNSLNHAAISLHS